jgi:hypothetical protein
VDGWRLAGLPLTLVDGRDAVDARAQVAYLAPDAAYPEGRRVWLAAPDWTTVRRIPWDHPADDETAPPVQTLLTWTPAPSDDYDAPGYQAETAALPGYYVRVGNARQPGAWLILQKADLGGCRLPALGWDRGSPPHRASR